MCLQYNWTIKLSAKSTRGSVRLIRNFLGPLRQSHQFLWPIYISGAASYLKVLSFQTGSFPFRLKIAISHSFFPPITSAQGLTQNWIQFLTNLYSWVSLLSQSFNITNRLFPIQTENSYFTLFFPPITSAQGLTQYRIWFLTNFYSWGSLLSRSFNITNQLFPIHPIHNLISDPNFIPEARRQQIPSKNRGGSQQWWVAQGCSWLPPGAVWGEAVRRQSAVTSCTGMLLTAPGGSQRGGSQ